MRVRGNRERGGGEGRKGVRKGKGEGGERGMGEREGGR